MAKLNNADEVLENESNHNYTAVDYAVACVESDIRNCALDIENIQLKIEELNLQISRKKEINFALTLRLKNLLALPKLKPIKEFKDAGSNL